MPVGLQSISGGAYQADLGRGVTGTTAGTWVDVNVLRSFLVTVSGVPGAGSWDLLVCNLMTRPLDSDNIHPSLQNGPNQQIGSIWINSPCRWIKFITTGVSGTLDCGLTGFAGFGL